MASPAESFESIFEASRARMEAYHHATSHIGKIKITRTAEEQRAIAAKSPASKLRRQKQASVDVASVIRTEVRDLARTLNTYNHSPDSTVYFAEEGIVRDCDIRGWWRHKEVFRPGTLYPTMPAWLLARFEFTTERIEKGCDIYDGFETSSVSRTHTLEYAIGANTVGELFRIDKVLGSKLEEPYEKNHHAELDRSQIQRRNGYVLSNSGPIQDDLLVPLKRIIGGIDTETEPYSVKWHDHLLRFAESIAEGHTPPVLSFDPR